MGVPKAIDSTIHRAREETEDKGERPAFTDVERFPAHRRARRGRRARRTRCEDARGAAARLIREFDAARSGDDSRAVRRLGVSMRY